MKHYKRHEPNLTGIASLLGRQVEKQKNYKKSKMFRLSMADRYKEVPELYFVLFSFSPQSSWKGKVYYRRKKEESTSEEKKKQTSNYRVEVPCTATRLTVTKRVFLGIHSESEPRGINDTGSRTNSF